MTPVKIGNNPVLILGGGLAGLSAAYHLKKSPGLVIEKEKKVGGTAQSFVVKGFTFDYSGHLLHLHFPYTKKLIKKILRNNYLWRRRNTWIFSKNTYTKFPFQANTYGLPDDTVDECVVGFFEAFLKNKNASQRNLEPNFKKWCLKIFGEGISRNFMFPYNEKLFRTKPEFLNTDWCGPFVPMPNLEDVILGGLQKDNRGFGYNQTFIYPKKGGIQALSDGLAKKLNNIKLNSEVKKIDWKNKVVFTSSGKKFPYSSLINTMPLPELMKKMVSLPPEIKSAALNLKYVSVLCVNIGVKRPHISDKSWIYFPEKGFPFYRVGFPMNFTPLVVPRGHSSMYIEISLKPQEKFQKRKLLAKIKKGLIQSQILEKSDQISVVQFLPIKYAYVIYDQKRRSSVRKIMAFLNKNKIQSVGRYGGWKYSFMEEAILDGKNAAEAVDGK